MEPSSSPRCPRCGYDQRGHVATWADSCPLRGRCTECGYEFDWHRIFFPDREHLRGFFEHAERRLQWWLWPWVTLRWALFPWTFWRKVTLYVKPVPRRMVLWLFIVCGAIWLLGVAVSIPATVYRSVQPQTWPGGWIAPRGGLWEGLANDALNPFMHYYNWERYAEHYRSRGLSPRPSVWRWDPRGYLHVALPFVLYGLSWPVLFIVLSETRRRCKVRPAQVLRASVYSFAWLAALALVLLVDRARLTVLTFDAQINRLTGWDPWQLLRLPWRWSVAAGGLFLWMSLWWLFAIRRGFRLTHAWAVWAVFMVAGVMLAIAGCLLVAPVWMHGILREVGLR